jgi:hypothetical protein
VPVGGWVVSRCADVPVGGWFRVLAGGGEPSLSRGGGPRVWGGILK